ncbi:unnamed protein product [Blepharisma stoltei]|uniref:Nudix hydrolase domain-containing protein n=1 Tax=Blepharisma stoltei TaxID=1481888 RepID=A0AAU9KCK5_9CILI|nr:unnamed protein product [Blepharisma stoltei]
MSEDRSPFSTHGFSVVVVRNFDGKWLAVKETRNRGWWLPAGLVDPGETFVDAAHRECLEESGIRIELKGILRVEHSVYGPTHARMRVVFFAMPIDELQIPKTIPDKESEEARWVTLDDLRRLAKGRPGLRGPELYEWGGYIEKGGMIAPLHFLCREDEPTPTPQLLSGRGNETIPRDLKSFISALERGDEASLKKAVLAGFNVNLVINDKSWTLLHLACKLNQENCVQILLLGGADIAASTHKNRNVIHFAAQSTPSTLVNVLIAAARLPNKLDLINQQDDEGNSPLHFAAASPGRAFLWEVLIENGADSNLRNQQGLKPADIASISQPGI